MLPKSIKKLIEEFSKLPGVGPKSAQRLAMHLIRSPNQRSRDLGDAVLKLKEGIIFCSECWNIADRSPCPICSDPSRDRSKICVVEEVLDAAAIEKTGDYDGLYHVLHGVLSPVDGVGVEELKISSLLKRIADSLAGNAPTAASRAATAASIAATPTVMSVVAAATHETIATSAQPSVVSVKEIILATNPSLEGEATALYIQKLLRDVDIKISRIARGLPTGGNIEYSDDLTLSRAMKNRGDF